MPQCRQQQEPTEATRGWLNAAPERRRNLRPSGRGGCQRQPGRGPTRFAPVCRPAFLPTPESCGAVDVGVDIGRPEPVRSRCFPTSYRREKPGVHQPADRPRGNPQPLRYLSNRQQHGRGYYLRVPKGDSCTPLIFPQTSHLNPIISMPSSRHHVSTVPV